MEKLKYLLIIITFIYGCSESNTRHEQTVDLQIYYEDGFVSPWARISNVPDPVTQTYVEKVIGYLDKKESDVLSAHNDSMIVTSEQFTSFEAKLGVVDMLVGNICVGIDVMRISELGLALYERIVKDDPKWVLLSYYRYFEKEATVRKRLEGSWEVVDESWLPKKKFACNPSEIETILDMWSKGQTEDEVEEWKKLYRGKFDLVEGDVLYELHPSSVNPNSQ